MNTPSPKSNTFVATIDLKHSERMIADLKEQGFEISIPPYTIFSAKKKGLSCTLYQSGKLTVQGKDMGSFIEFYLEPKILQTFQFTYENLDLDMTARIGIDESGKGDFFGPLCIAGVFAGGEDIPKLKLLGVRDSKKISDPMIIVIGNKIRAAYTHHIVKINPAKYNELIKQFGNLNHLLAWGHATTIEQLVAKTECRNVLIDQFANEKVVLTALKRKNLDLNLKQRHRAEEDLVVAAASILARQAFLEGLESLGREFSMKFPKGASAATIAAGRKFVEQFDVVQLAKVGKMHFKTVDAIMK